MNNKDVFHKLCSNSQPCSLPFTGSFYDVAPCCQSPKAEMYIALQICSTQNKKSLKVQLCPISQYKHSPMHTSGQQNA